MLISWAGTIIELSFIFLSFSYVLLIDVNYLCTWVSLVINVTFMKNRSEDRENKEHLLYVSLSIPSQTLRASPLPEIGESENIIKR